MEKKNVVLLTVIAVATLLITVIGATFAYYAATIEGNPQDNSVNVTAAKGLAISFDDGAEITATNILPGWTSDSKTVKVTNTSDYEMEYTINWLAVTNSITDKENLTYSADVSTGWGAEDKHPHTTNSEISQISNHATPDTSSTETFATQKIKPGEEITYNITLNYKNVTDANQGSEEHTTTETFTGQLQIQEKNVKVISTEAVLPQS